MSVLIKGMEMPKVPTRVIIFADGRVEDEDDSAYKYSAVHVPPHGNLTDRDAYRDEFMDGVYELCSDDPDNNRANAIIDLFDSAPIVIPAEEEWI